MVGAYSEISIPELPLHKKGKVHEVCEIEDKLLIVVSDRISAFDYVLPSLIPDSSRFWPLASYSPCQYPPSLDKQFVRNYLESTDWDKESPPPPLPQSIIEQTSKRYLEIYSILTGKNEL